MFDNLMFDGGAFVFGAAFFFTCFLKGGLSFGDVILSLSYEYLFLNSEGTNDTGLLSFSSGFNGLFN